MCVWCFAIVFASHSFSQTHLGVTVRDKLRTGERKFVKQMCSSSRDCTPGWTGLYSFLYVCTSDSLRMQIVHIFGCFVTALWRIENSSIQQNGNRNTQIWDTVAHAKASVADTFNFNLQLEPSSWSFNLSFQPVSSTCAFNLTLQHGSSSRIFHLNLQPGLSAWTFNLNLQLEPWTWTLKLNLQIEPSSWNFNWNPQPEPSTRTCSLNLQLEPSTCANL